MSMMYGQSYGGQSYIDGEPQYSSRRKREDLDSCGQCVRYLLIAANIVFLMCSMTVVGVTSWILVEKDYMSVIYGNVLMTVGGYLIVIGAALAFFVTLIGCFGAIARSKVPLIIYFCALCLIFFLLFIGAILAIVYRTQIRNELKYTVMEKTIRNSYGVDLKDSYNEFVTHAWDKAQRQIDHEVHNYMRTTIQRDYGHSLHIPYNKEITHAWDKCQEELKCCGVEDQGWNIYRDSEWYNNQSGNEYVDKPYVPKSCCVRDQYGDYLNVQKCQTFNQGPPGRNSGDENTSVYYRGCYNAGRDFIIEYSGYLIGMGMGVGIAMIGGIVLAFILVRLID